MSDYVCGECGLTRSPGGCCCLDEIMVESESPLEEEAAEAAAKLRRLIEAMAVRSDTLTSRCEHVEAHGRACDLCSLGTSLVNAAKTMLDALVAVVREGDVGGVIAADGIVQAASFREPERIFRLVGQDHAEMIHEQVK
jgi:hypothetical protein